MTDAISIIVNLLSNFAAFLQIIHTLLFLYILIGGNLSPDLFGVIYKCLTFVFFNFPFLLFNLFLLLDLAHIVLAFNTSLFSKIYLLFLELPLSSLFKISSNTLSFFMFKLLTETSLSFSLFECTFGS